MDQLGCLVLFLVPGLHGAFEFLRVGLCRGVSVGEKILLEFVMLCLDFIPEELRGLLVSGRDFRYGFVAFFSGSFARCLDGSLEELCC